MSKVLQQKLTEKSMPEAAAAAKIVALVNEAIHKTRELSRGLLPVLSEPGGLMSALERLASELQDLFHIWCRFVCPEPVLIHDNSSPRICTASPRKPPTMPSGMDAPARSGSCSQPPGIKSR